MNILLEKVRIDTLFSRFNPIVVEPLELEYLSTKALELDYEVHIIDNLFNKKNLPFEPDVILLTGYNVAEDEMLKRAMEYKRRFSTVKIVLGGVHVQLNAEDFRKDYVDFVVHSQSLKVFDNIIAFIEGKSVHMNGFDFNSPKGWIVGEKLIVNSPDNFRPNREFFYNISERTYYLNKKNVALIKSSIGCPFDCSYCYCKEINDGKFIKTDYKKMVEEISTIDADYFWIVDDTLFLTRDDAQIFIDEVKALNINKKYIAYLRADFIIKNKDMIRQLKSIGLDEIIIGFEAVTKEELMQYNKATDIIDYPEIIRLLKDLNMDYSALFIVQGNYVFKDFRRLYRFIKDNDIEIYTLSIFTPMKGTKDFRQDELTTRDPRKFDFLHLVVKSKLPKFIFYILFYGMHIRLFKSKRIRKYLFQRR